MKKKIIVFNAFIISSLLLISTFSNAAIPAGYYLFAKNKQKSELKTALKNVSSPLRVLEYGSGQGFTWEGFYYTDRQSDSNVMDMYSNVVRKQTNYWAVNEMHIEHSFPKSWWGAHENMAYKDLFHLYPADAVTNMTKSNLPLGEVKGTPTLDNGVSKVGENGFGTAYSENCFEPADAYKGDFARSYLYISSIYEDFSQLWQSPMLNNNTYPVWKPWAIDLLLKWHRQDPVSTKELTRNEAIYQIQGNRNPFIDYPTLADFIWGADTTSVFPFPTETQAYLTSPQHGMAIDFGTIMTNDSRTETLHIEGANISSNISVLVKNATSSIQLSTNELSPQNVLNGININLTFAPTSDGSIRDTLIISDGGLTENRYIPIRANVSPDFLLLEPTYINPQGGTLQWISDPAATDYLLKVFQPEKKAGDMIISSYIEGSSWNKAIEIYNGTGKTVDLSKYALRKQSNGDGAFGMVLPLNGQLQNNKTYTIVHKAAEIAALTQKANLLTDALLQVNGNDAICLTHNGMIIDMVGEANAGADVIWGLDLTLRRKNTITHPQSVFERSEWNVLPVDSVAFIGTHAMAFVLSEPVFLKNELVGKVTNHELTNLQPNSKYTYSVEAVKADGNVEATNTMQLHTSALTAPEVLSADNINSDSFTANWEEDLYAYSYLVDVFTTSGTANKTETEAFDKVGTGGTPLPTGWSGTASGNYTSTTSSGLAIPSVALKNNGEKLLSKIYDAPVTNLTFMYRFASDGTGSSLKLEALQDAQWLQIANYPYVNTTKAYPTFDFTATQNYRQFRFTYTKSSGNMAIDDVQATYGQLDTVFIERNKEVIGTKYLVENLQTKTNYYYRVKSKLGTSTSDYSDVMATKTLVQTDINQINEDAPKFYKSENSLIISNLTNAVSISIFDITGKYILNKSVANQHGASILFDKKGIYIVRVQTKNEIFTKKITF